MTAESKYYIAPEADYTWLLPESALVSSFNPDDHTEYLDYDDGGLL